MTERIAREHPPEQIPEDAAPAERFFITMSFGIYKQGQGYWVRVMTAAFVGVLIISAAAWGWSQAGIIRIPAKAWTLAIFSVDGEVSVGDSVELYYFDPESPTPEIPESIGTAIVAEYSASNNSTATIVVDTFENDLVRDLTNDAVEIRSVDSRSGTQDDPKLTAQIRSRAPTPVFPVEYLQSGVAGGIMLLGAIGLYIFIGSKKQTVEFLIATDAEMKKVNWTTYKEVKGSTIVVIVATFLIAGFLFGVDRIFAEIFLAVGVLEK
jgi:preprotein translocase SecE subunit